MVPPADQLACIRSIDAATDERFGPPLPVDGTVELENACAAAAAAFDAYRQTSSEARAGFLDRICFEIMELGERLVDLAARETGLPRTRIESERGRTVGQLQLFAELLRSGTWTRTLIDPALPDRRPLPRPDVRLRMIPLGPVAVFGASNFPLAFSTAGGDTASALAAGCPVVVKGHPGHPGTHTLVAGAVQTARDATGMPKGAFGQVMGPGIALGTALVADPRIAAVAYTGSRRGGLALGHVARQRSVPIPLYAEMSSINPVILLPEALRVHGPALAASFVASLTLGGGQFCTKPGLVLAVQSAALEGFITATAAALSCCEAATMLSRDILDAYRRGVHAFAAHPKVQRLAEERSEKGYPEGQAALFRCAAADFISDPVLAEEVFGPAALLVCAEDTRQLRCALEGLEGQLTSTLHMAGADLAEAADLLPLLERKAGRIIANGWPTGVEVTHAMMHGGPYPASSDSRATSVGSLAIERFLRPVSYQNMPAALLPSSLRDAQS